MIDRLSPGNYSANLKRVPVSDGISYPVQDFWSTVTIEVIKKGMPIFNKICSKVFKTFRGFGRGKQRGSV